jgi:hypothetical protein
VGAVIRTAQGPRAGRGRQLVSSRTPIAEGDLIGRSAEKARIARAPITDIIIVTLIIMIMK